MKIYIITFIAILLMFYADDGKAQQRNSYWINGVAGLNSNWIMNQNAYGNQEMEYATAFGLAGGIGASFFYSNDWGMNTSLFLNQSGQNYSGYQGGAPAERKLKLTYLEIPLLVMRQIPYMNFPTWVSAGPGIMILLKAKQDYSRKEGGSVLPNPEGMVNGDVTERFMPVDITMNIAINRMVSLDYFRKMMFLFSVNSSFGLFDISKPEWRIPNTHDVYGRSHNFYIGAKVGLMYKAGRIGGRRW